MQFSTYLRRYSHLFTFLLFTFSSFLHAQTVSYGVETERHHPVYAEHGMVASQEALATQVGIDILKKGGNAIDAAAAVGFALAVTHPQAGNIGGGGFMVIRLKDGTNTTIDFREVAPKAATRDMFLNEKGEADSQKSLTSPLAVGVPGTVAGLLYAQDKYGAKERQLILNPAIQLAAEGFTVSRGLAKTLQNYAPEVMSQHAASRSIFFNEDNVPLQAGQQLIQKDLANALKRIQQQGRDGFYKGETAEKIVATMEKLSGLMTLEDLATYQPIEREPLIGQYKGYTVITMPPPSSGGIHLIQLLNILESFDLKNSGHNSAASIQVMAEAMKHAYADRSEYLGDPDFYKVPVQALLSKAYANDIAKLIKSNNKPTPSSTIKPGKLTPYESDQTTHFSVVDSEGNAVAVTYTLNTNFGTGIVAEGTGILLNNQMDDFSAKPGTANVYGLIGGEANAIAPHKRPLSSMTPTIIVRDNQPILVTGSPGGSRIITTVLQTVLNVIEHNMNIAEATSAPRVHHQWLPDYLRVESGISQDTLNILKQQGYEIKQQPVMGSTQSIMLGQDGLYGASDPRSDSGLTAGY